jgi:hypothetical protein
MQIGGNDMAIGASLRTRLGEPDGDVLCEQTVSPTCTSCRTLPTSGITGPVETWREGVSYACVRGDIEKAAGLTTEENSTTSPRQRGGNPNPVYRIPIPAER